MENSIKQLMDDEHQRINKILNKFEEELNYSSFENLAKIFNQFKWNLDKHFFVEEKAIFDIFEKIENDEVTEIFDLMQEHGEIIELIKNIEERLNKKVKPDVSGLKKRLIDHLDLEDKMFYPKLDEELEPYKKQELISRIKEIIRE